MAMKTLHGLRGLAALHVTCTHVGMIYVVDFMSGATMGLFYILSGFLLTVTYAGKHRLRIGRPEDFPIRSGDAMYAALSTRLLGSWAKKKNLENSTEASIGMNEKPSSASVLGGWTFIQKRFMKLLPMYYMGMLLGISAMCLSYPERLRIMLLSPKKILLSVMVLTSWSPPLMPVGNIFLWTTSTVLFFYAAFPILAPVLQSVEPEHMRNVAFRMYLLQSIWMILFLGAFLLHSNDFAWYMWARNFPPGRIPVFIMGCCAGMEHLQQKSCCEKDNNSIRHRISADRQALRCLVPICIGILVGFSGSDSEPVSEYRAIYMDNLLARWILEMAMPIVFYDLVLIIMEPSQRNCHVVRLCSGQVAQFLGNISLSLYVGHLPVILIAIKWIPALKSCWSIIPISLLAIGFSWVLHHVFEKGLFAYISCRTSKKKNQ